MSVLLVRASELCQRCVMKTHPFRGAQRQDSLRVFIEFNDLCTACTIKCQYQYQNVVVREPYPSEECIVQQVRRKSPWLRQQRWSQRWVKVREFTTDPLNILYYGLLAVAMLLMVAAFIAAWKVVR